MDEGETPKTITEIVQEITGDNSILAQFIGSEMVMYRNGSAIGQMVWNPVMTARQKQRILRLAGVAK